MRHIGKFKWFGCYNHKKGGVNDFGFIESLMGDDIYVHRTQINFPFFTDKSLENKVITFEAQKICPYGGGAKRAVNLLLVDDETDKDVLIDGFLADNYQYPSSVIRRLFALLNDNEIIKVIEKRIEKETDSNSLLNLIPYEKEALLLSPEATLLREKLPTWYRLQLYQHLERLEPFETEIIECKQLASESEWHSFCTSVKPKIQYCSTFYEVASDQIKDEILRKVLETRYKRIEF